MNISISGCINTKFRTRKPEVQLKSDDTEVCSEAYFAFVKCVPWRALVQLSLTMVTKVIKPNI